MLQLACTLTFEAVHGTSCDAGVNHPNQYFSLSQRAMQPKVRGSSSPLLSAAIRDLRVDSGPADLDLCRMENRRRRYDTMASTDGGWAGGPTLLCLFG